MCPTSRKGVFTRRSAGQTYRLQRDGDAVRAVYCNEETIGFIGSDKINEYQPPIGMNWLGEVQGCDLVVAAAEDEASSVEYRLQKGERLKLVTSLPQWTARLALARGWQFDIESVLGGEEGYIDIADCIATLRISGDTLAGNDAREVVALERIKFGLMYNLRSEL